MIDYRMPALGADMEAGTLVEWLVKPGDKVKSGSIIAVVETQKGAIEIEVFHEGTIAEITVPIGQRVPVGTILAHIDDGTPPSPLPPVQVEIPAPVGKTVKSTGETTAPPAPLPSSLGWIAAGGARLKITPVARRRAAALGVDPRNVTGSGIEGSIRLADIERVARERAREAPACRRLRRRRDARRHRRGDDPLEARNSALLFDRDDRPGARSRLARIRQRRRSRRKIACFQRRFC